MSKQDVTISCPHCLREYSLALDLEKLTRIRKQAVCARCKQSFDVGSRVVVREGAPRVRASRRSAPAIAAIRPNDPARARRGVVAREEVLSPRRGHEDFSAPRPGAASNSPPTIDRWSPMSKPTPAPSLVANGADRWRPARPPTHDPRVSAVARAAFERAVAEREAADRQGSEPSEETTARPPRPPRGATTPPSRPASGSSPAQDALGLARTLPIPKGDWLARADVGLGALSRESNPALRALESLLAGAE